MTSITEILITSSKPNEMIKLTSLVEDVVSKSSVGIGSVTVITAHTTTGITVNEGLECLEDDILQTLKRIVPDELPYKHARFLPTYGRTSANATGHLRGMLLGNSCVFPIRNARMLLGDAQEIYLVELDGPQQRKIYVEIAGE